MNFQSLLDGVHRTVIELGALAFTILFIVRVCVHEIRRMKLRKPEWRQKLAK
jgi:hypothetical protein